MIYLKRAYNVTKSGQSGENMGLKKYIQCLQVVYIMLLTGMVFPWSFLDNTSKIESMDPGRAEMFSTNARSCVSETEFEKPKIAITFDDGPNITYTPQLLDGLKKRNVRATFFLVGQNMEAEQNQAIVRRMFEEGHLIGNHSYHHLEIPKLELEEAVKEIKDTEMLIEQITGEKSGYFRPPYGSWDKRLEKQVSVIPILWTIDPRDWENKNRAQIVNKVVTEVKENDIILLHDCYGSSVEAALEIIDILKNKGFDFVTVEQLIMD